MIPTKVALVTASSAGLGAAIAKALILDMRVVINYQSSHERANEVLGDLKTRSRSIDSNNSSVSGTYEPRFAAIKADVSTRHGIQQLVCETIRLMGRIDVVVSNAGWTRLTDFMNLDENVIESDWDKCFNVNVKSHLFLMSASRPYLEDTEGAFITVASAAGVTPSGSSLAYAVTKAAQIYLVKCLAMIVSPKIRVNSVSPSILMTDWGRRFPEEKLDIAKNKTLLKRFATIEDVAAQVKCLALSSSTTGVNAIIDSGFSIS